MPPVNAFLVLVALRAYALALRGLEVCDLVLKGLRVCGLALRDLRVYGLALRDPRVRLLTSTLRCLRFAAFVAPECPSADSAPLVHPP
jgi:hypothetical protein